MLRVAGVALIGVILTSVLKKNEPAAAGLVGLAAVILLFFAVLDETKALRAFLEDLMLGAGIASEYAFIPVKALGLTLLTQLAADTAKDAGQTTLASQIEFAGRALILYTALPVLKAVLQVVSALVNSR